MASFVHLHLHTEYSLLDGAVRMAQLMERAVEFGIAGTSDLLSSLGSLTPDDVSQGTQGTIHGFRTPEDAGYVRFEDDHVCTFSVTPRIFGTDAT